MWRGADVCCPIGSNPNGCLVTVNFLNDGDNIDFVSILIISQV